MIKKAAYTFFQLTWGLPQTLLGLVLYLKNLRRPHESYLSSINTHWKSKGGISLGLFIFTPDMQTPNYEKIRVHEYGHTIQSLILGPLYLPFIGIISYTWANLPFFKRIRKEKRIPYTACFVEAWASRLGEWVTGEEAIWQ